MSMMASAVLTWGIPLDPRAGYPWEYQYDEEIYDIHSWWEGMHYQTYLNNKRAAGEEGPGSGREFRERHPLPAEVVISGPEEDPIYLLAIGAHAYADWDEPQKVDLSQLVISEEQKKAFLDFIEQYKIPVKPGGEPGWFLSCLFG